MRLLGTEVGSTTEGYFFRNRREPIPTQEVVGVDPDRNGRSDVLARKLDPVARWFNKIHQAVFLASKGRVGGRMMGVDLVALSTTGRKSGERRTSMLGAPIIEDDMVILVASYAAGPTNPQWYFNLLADPEVEIVVKGRTRKMIAHEAEGSERSDIWARVAAQEKNFDKFQARTQRRFPVIVLESL